MKKTKKILMLGLVALFLTTAIMPMAMSKSNKSNIKNANPEPELPLLLYAIYEDGKIKCWTAIGQHQTDARVTLILGGIVIAEGDSGKDGYIEFDISQPGEYIVRAEKDGYEPVEQIVIVREINSPGNNTPKNNAKSNHNI